MLIGITAGSQIMGRIVLPRQRIRLIITISIALIVYISIYLGWAIYTASMRYSNALALSESRAHTTLGKEGYEYIFEPSTHLLVDKIQPLGREISFFVLKKDYLPFHRGYDCSFLDQNNCIWMDINIFYDHDPAPMVQKMSLYAAIIVLIFGGGFFLLTSQPVDVQ